MKFKGTESEINVKTKNAEFFKWKWVEIKKLPQIAVHFKADIYERIKKELLSLKLS